MPLRTLALLSTALLLPAQGARLQKGEAYALLRGADILTFGEDESARPGAYVGNGFWFRTEGRAFLVKDAAVVAAVRAAVEPVTRLGAEQGRLGAVQGRLGAKQGALGAEQGRLGARLAGASGADRAALASEMERLADRQRALAKEQEALGGRQRDLGRRQEAASEAAVVKLRALRDRALAQGLAQAL